MSFENIKGQDNAINILKGYIEQARLRGGYLFAGPQGLGKKLVAKTLAKAVNCLKDNLDSCDKCASCRKIEDNQHPDVHFIESDNGEINPVRSSSANERASDGIKIEYIRQLQRDISLRPYEGKVKVFIIDNAHNLTPEAQAAILKILEEPPKNSLIILISDKPALLFKTIISRCKILKFSALPRMELKEILKNDYGLDNTLAHFLAYFSEGRLGSALGLKDADILREKNRVIDKFALAHKINLEGLALQNKEGVRSYFNILATWYRDIYLIKIGMPHSEMINFDRRDDLLRQMSNFSFVDLNEILDTISDSIFGLQRNINTKLLIYNLGAQLCRG